MEEFRAGSRWRSAVCDAEVIVVRAPVEPEDLWCGGRPMVALGSDPPANSGVPDPEHSNGTQLGKRYADPETGLEVLCTKAGQGSLSLAGKPLALKDAKPLPSSD